MRCRRRVGNERPKETARVKDFPAGYFPAICCRYYYT